MPHPNVSSSVAVCICLDLAAPALAVGRPATAMPPAVSGKAAETFKVTPNSSLAVLDAIRSVMATGPRVSHEQLSVPGQSDPGKMIWITSRSAGEVNCTDRLVNLDVERQRIKDSPASDPSMTNDRAYDQKVPDILCHQDCRGVIRPDGPLCGL